ncbi:uncharacterized protein LOC143677442 isoform X2 [Tamandua tetradactyla]|uniref:uncharacterized protein LOC143677442 isoform X2 n=1 Tax=Tamandua tetradactyla TaxID=48850 RepID=UPI0040542AE4
MAGCELPGLCPPSCRGQSEMKWPCQPCVQRPRARSWKQPVRPKLRKSWSGWVVRHNSLEDVWPPHRGAHASLPMGRSWAPHGDEEREPKGRRGKEHKKRTAAPDLHPDGDGAEGRLLGRCAQSCSSDAGHPRYGQKLSDPLYHKGKTELEAVGTEVAADQDPRAPTYVGLINQGLTCYLNALLQCLFLTPEFLDKIQESPKSSELEQALNQIFCRLAEQRGAVPTQALTACLNLGYGQRDVGDVFLYLLQSLGREDLQEVFQSEVEKVIRCSVCDVEDYIPSGGRMLLLPLASHAQLCGLGEEQVPQEPTQESAGLSQVPGPSPDGQGGCPSAERAGRGFTLPPLPPSFHLCWAQMPLLSEHCRQVGNGHLGCLGLDWPWAGVLGTQSRCPWGRAPGCHSDLEGAGYPPRTRAQGGAVGARSRACCRQGFPWQQNRWAKGQWCRLGKTLGKSVEHRGGAVEEQVAGGGPQGREVESGGAQGLPCLAKT